MLRSRQRLSHCQRGPADVQSSRTIMIMPLVIPLVEALAEVLTDRADQEAA